MAQDSAMWQGKTIGDAASTDVWSAPYSAAEFADIHSKILGGNKDSAYVIPGYGNDLKITANSPAAMNVLVNTGAAWIKGRIYENTASETLTIAAADPTNPRLDRIILRVLLDEDTDQTIRLAVLTGTAAATPALPALTQNSTTYEVAIGRVYVTAAAASIADTEVHDERQFVATFDQIYKSYLSENLIRNSEYMAYSARNPVSVSTTTPPDYWDLVATPTTFTRFAMSAFTTPSRSRGGYISLDANAANEGMSQTFSVKPSTTYCIKIECGCLVAANYASIQVTTNAASPNTVTKNERRVITVSTGLYEHQIIYTTESDASTMTVSLLAATNSANDSAFGQCIVVEGYIAGPFREFHEVLPFTKDEIGDTSWNLTAKSTGVTQFDLTSNFGGLIMPRTQGLMCIIGCNDSGSAAGTASLILFGGGGSGVFAARITLDGVVNDKIRYTTGTISINGNNIATGFTISYTATGASTLDVLVAITGIIT